MTERQKMIYELTLSGIGQGVGMELSQYNATQIVNTILGKPEPETGCDCEIEEGEKTTLLYVDYDECFRPLDSQEIYMVIDPTLELMLENEDYVLRLSDNTLHIMLQDTKVIRINW